MEFPLPEMLALKKLTTFATLAAVVLLVTATFAQVPASSHVVLVMEENESASSVIGSSSAWTYLNSLATQYGQATNFYGNYHPSIDNYFMITAGTNPAKNNDSFTGTVSADNIVRHMLTAGVTWKSYAQSLPSVGYTGGNVTDSQGKYYIRHNPFAYFSDVRNSTGEAANLVPFTQFATDLANNQLPNFTYIVPNGTYDAHDGTPAQADSFLKTNLAPLLASPAFQPGGDGLLIIGFDEAATSDSTHGGGRIAVVMVGPNVKPGYKSTVLYQQQNLGRTIFEALGLSSTGYPGAIATACRHGGHVRSYRCQRQPRRQQPCPHWNTGLHDDRTRRGHDAERVRRRHFVHRHHPGERIQQRGDPELLRLAGWRHLLVFARDGNPVRRDDERHHDAQRAHGPRFVRLRRTKASRCWRSPCPSSASHSDR